MSEENETVETLIKRRADLIIKKKEHTKHIEDFLEYFFSESGIKFKDIPVDVFKICAVDAMIYDVGAALDSPDWKSYKKRTKMLKKIFPTK
jgi:hypothetical protein